MINRRSIFAAIVALFAGGKAQPEVVITPACTAWNNGQCPTCGKQNPPLKIQRMAVRVITRCGDSDAASSNWHVPELNQKVLRCCERCNAAFFQLPELE